MGNQNRQTLFLKLLLGLVIFNCVGIFTIIIWRNSNDQEGNTPCNITAISKKILGKPFPKNEFMNINRTIGAYLGNDTTALVSFIDSKCDACLFQITTLSDKAKWKGKQLKMFLISGESPGVLQEFIERNKIETPVLIDNQQILKKDLGIFCTPTNILIEDGIVKQIEIGNIINFKELVIE
jgi:peroxiredoxin